MEHKLIAFYEQTLNASERKEVEQWLEADPENKKIYEHTITIWKNASIASQYKLYNKQEAWKKLQQQLGEENIVQKKVYQLSLNWWKFSAIAASVAAIIVLVIFTNKPESIQFMAQSEHKNIELADKSHITLFSNAKLLVAADFNKEKRTVTLNGNAFFDIAKSPQKPFIIHNNDMDVQVLGTSFTIQQRAMFNTVFVHSGKVKATLKGQSVTATAQQKIIKNNTTHQLKVVNMHTDIDEILKTQTLRIKDVRIDSLTNMMEELYNIKVITTPALNGKKITSTYLIGSETPEQIIENIALTIGASWSKKNNQYLITK